MLHIIEEQDIAKRTEILFTEYQQYMGNLSVQDFILLRRAAMQEMMAMAGTLEKQENGHSGYGAVHKSQSPTMEAVSVREAVNYSAYPAAGTQAKPQPQPQAQPQRQQVQPPHLPQQPQAQPGTGYPSSRQMADADFLAMLQSVDD